MPDLGVGLGRRRQAGVLATEHLRGDRDRVARRCRRLARVVGPEAGDRLLFRRQLGAGSYTSSASSWNAEPVCLGVQRVLARRAVGAVARGEAAVATPVRLQRRRERRAGSAPTDPAPTAAVRREVARVALVAAVRRRPRESRRTATVASAPDGAVTIAGTGPAAEARPRTTTRVPSTLLRAGRPAQSGTGSGGSRRGQRSPRVASRRPCPSRRARRRSSPAGCLRASGTRPSPGRPPRRASDPRIRAPGWRPAGCSRAFRCTRSARELEPGRGHARHRRRRLRGSAARPHGPGSPAPAARATAAPPARTTSVRRVSRGSFAVSLRLSPLLHQEALHRTSPPSLCGDAASCGSAPARRHASVVEDRRLPEPARVRSRRPVRLRRRREDRRQARIGAARRGTCGSSPT